MPERGIFVWSYSKVYGERGEIWCLYCDLWHSILFILYTNDLPNYLEFDKLNLYVDNTAMLVSSGSQVALMLMLRMALHTVSEWLKASRLTLNAKKPNTVFLLPESPRIW